jgi:hypothetical protein
MPRTTRFQIRRIDVDRDNSLRRRRIEALQPIAPSRPQQREGFWTIRQNKLAQRVGKHC